MTGAASSAWCSSSATSRSGAGGARRNARLTIEQVLAEATTAEDALPRILEAVCDGLGWDLGASWTVNAGMMHCRSVWRRPGADVDEFEAVTRRIALPRGVGLPGRVWNSRGCVWIPDVVHEPNFPRAPIAARQGLHAAFGCPLLIDNEVVGVLEFFSHQIREPDEDLLEMMTTVGGQIGQFLQRKQAEEQAARGEADRRDAAPHRHPAGGRAGPGEARAGGDRRDDPADGGGVRRVLLQRGE